MAIRECLRNRLATTALFALMSLAAVGCSSSSGSPSDGNGFALTADRFTVVSAGQTLHYSCDEQPLDETAGPRIVSTGCNWPSNDPRVEIDFGVQGSKPLSNVTFDLSAPTATSDILFTVGLAQQADVNVVSIYSSFGQGGGTVAPGTSGTITVNSYDPSTGHMNIVATDVTLPVSEFNSYAGAPNTITVQSAEIIR